MSLIVHPSLSKTRRWSLFAGLLLTVIALGASTADSARAAKAFGGCSAWGTLPENPLGLFAGTRACFVAVATNSGLSVYPRVVVDTEVWAGDARNLTFCGLYYAVYRSSGTQVAHGQQSCTANARSGRKTDGGATLTLVGQRLTATSGMWIQSQAILDFQGRRHTARAAYP